MKAWVKPSVAAIALVVGLTTGGAARAQGDPFQPSPDQRQTIYDCLENARGMERLKIGALCIGVVSNACTEIPQNQTTQGMAACYGQEKTIWDELLNDWYGRARESMSAPVGKLFRDAQREWIKWRDAKCDFAYGQFEGGTLGISTSAYCVMETTATRAPANEEMRHG